MKPEVVHIALTFADDTIGIMSFVTREQDRGGKVRWTRVADTDAINAEIERTSASLDPWKVPVKGWVPIDPADVPADRTYRNALRHDGVRFHHDMNHAKELHRAALRHARAPKLLALDIAYQRADEKNDQVAKRLISEQKQALRDVTTHPAIDEATTTDELKMVWPEILVG